MKSGLVHQYTNEKSDSYSLGKIIAELWGYFPNHSQYDSTTTKEVIIERIINSDTQFFVNIKVEDIDGVLTRLLFILEKMCMRNAEHRFDLATGKKALEEIQVFKNQMHQAAYIVDERTKDKLIESAARMNIILFSNSNLRTIPTWQVNRPPESSPAFSSQMEKLGYQSYVVADS